MTNKAPLIRRLKIERFRGIKEFVWYPTEETNVILGGGDVGKTTVLDAIALLLHPTNATTLSDADYWLRGVEDGFLIEAVMSLSEETGISQQRQATWPWNWDGKEPQLPSIDESATVSAEPAQEAVYVVRVRGTAEFDLFYEVIQPNGEADHFSVSTRRAIGLVRLGGDDKNDRDLRLIQGSALDRLLSDSTLRARLGKTLNQADVTEELSPEAKTKLTELNTSFGEKALPDQLGLGIAAGQGLSISALIGLTAEKSGVHLPLVNWGAGTRRLSSLEIAAAQQTGTPITIVDEIERGLEPYRQRILMSRLQKQKSQAFVTTHSRAALAAATSASAWYIDAKGTIAALPKSTEAHRQIDPETFLSCLAIVCEGKTEFGFVSYLLEKTVGIDFLEHGLWITDGGGNEKSLGLLEGLAVGGLSFGGFVDNEGTYPSRWSNLKSKLGPLLFQWPAGCVESNVIAVVPDNMMQAFISDPTEERTGMRLRTLADRLELGDERSFEAVRAKAPDLKSLVIAAALGKPPLGKEGEAKKYRGEASCWFKNEAGGRELAAKIYSLGIHVHLESQLLPFVNAIRATVGLSELTSIHE